MPKGCESGAKIDVKTYQRLMPKLVAKKEVLMTIFKNKEVLQGGFANGEGINKP